MLLKFGAVLSIIYDLLVVVLYLDPFSAVYCCRAVVSEEVTDARKKLPLNLLVLVRRDGEQSVVGVRTVFDDAMCLSQTLHALESLDGGE